MAPRDGAHTLLLTTPSLRSPCACAPRYCLSAFYCHDFAGTKYMYYMTKEQCYSPRVSRPPQAMLCLKAAGLHKKAGRRNGHRSVPCKAWCWAAFVNFSHFELTLHF